MGYFLRKRCQAKNFFRRYLPLFCLFFSGVVTATLSFGANDPQKISPPLEEKLKRQKNSTFKVWIYFQDRGEEVASSLVAVRQNLNYKTLERRRRVLPEEKVVDELDVPVNEKYIEKLRPYLINLKHASRWLNAVSAVVAADSLKTIAAWPIVSRIEEVARHHFKLPLPESLATSPAMRQPVGLHTLEYGPSFPQVSQIMVPPLHDLGINGTGITIALLDSGFNNLDHEAFRHLRVEGTWDFVNNDPDVADQPGQMGSGNHGTETLGVIAGFSPGKLIGPAYGANFLLAKTENTDWERHIEEDDWLAGVEWAESLGADIISSSLGYRSDFTHGEADYTWENMDGETTIVSRGANIAARRGVLIINSAGNEGFIPPPRNTLVAPADSFWVLAVGAVDSAGQRVSFSSVGPTADGRLKPDVMAMGRSVYSASPDKPDGYLYVSGTSFSCPLVAGAAALVWQLNPGWSNYDVLLALKLTATNSSNPNNLVGWGVLDALRAAFYPLRKFYPPSHFAVKRVENNLIFFKEYIDRLRWRENERNQEKIIAYRIYQLQLKEKNGQFTLLAEVGPTTFYFDRRGLRAGENFLYKITAVNRAGEESHPDYAGY